MKSSLGKIYTQNRELSWLKFNERVLEEAMDRTVPLLERLKFISIFVSNLDEFFMVRVGSLTDISFMDPKYVDNKSGMTASEQLKEIYKEVERLYGKLAVVYKDVIEELKCYDVFSLEIEELSKKEINYLASFYERNVEPIISPQIVDVHHPFPFIPSKEVFISALLRNKGRDVVGILPVPKSLPEVIFLPGPTVRFVKIEKLLLFLIDRVFEKYSIVEKYCMCVTRNADIKYEDENFDVEDDFRSRMMSLLHKRKRLSVVRFESNCPLSEEMMRFFSERFRIKKEHMYVSKADLKMGYVFSLTSKLSVNQVSMLCYSPFSPRVKFSGKSVTDYIRERDLLVHYPFESMSVFLQLLKEASSDPKVISIKITIYRLARNSRLIDYLCNAAENGKDVTVIVELRARFDEHNNIDWSEKLEEAGCRVVYGLPKYKVHSKVCLITYRNKDSVDYITQVGTGNYNEKTAELYTDLSLITSNREIGADGVEFFKNLLIGNTEGSYDRLLVAPISLKSGILDLIDKEIEKGDKGRIFMKMNSLTDLDVIDKLSMASCAGVKVCLVVRGICCIVPGVKGFTDNVFVMSIVGRFLEHSRIYCFGDGDDKKIYISSADLMTRNTERRVEVACPIVDKRIKEQIDSIVETILSDNVKARVLANNGKYYPKGGNGGLIDSQMKFLDLASNSESLSVHKKEKVFGKVLTFLKK